MLFTDIIHKTSQQGQIKMPFTMPQLRIPDWLSTLRIPDSISVPLMRFLDNSISGNLDRDCSPHFFRKFIIFMLIFLVTWTATKLPYYFQFDPNGDTPYEKGGLTGSINLCHWIPGYKSHKLHSPVNNFLLVHIGFGATVLIMMTLALIDGSYRKRFGRYFFVFGFLLGLHTIPASVTMNAVPLAILFTFVSLLTMTVSVFGYRTLRNYEGEYDAKAERHLAIEYGLVTFFAYGAGFAELAFILLKVRFRLANGYWPSYGDSPDPKFGHGFYFMLPESVGMTIFVGTVIIFWVWWPIKLLKIKNDPASKSNASRNDSAISEESTLLDKQLYHHYS